MGSTVHEISMESARRLPRLKPGEEATIWALCTSAGGPLTARLMALGFVPGTTIRALRRAPLQDPTEYEVRGTRISLRSSEAFAIILRDAEQTP